MSTQQAPLTYEGILELFRETGQKIREVSEQMKETDRIINQRFEKTDRQIELTSQEVKRTSQEIGNLSSSVGRIIESMVASGVVDKFRAFGYVITKYSSKVVFGKDELNNGEIDLFLENGDIAIIVEVKTTLKPKHVSKHVERIEKYRRYTDSNGGDKRRYIGAVAGAVVSEETVKFAHRNGMYVIVQSGKAFEIKAPPKEFLAKQW